MYRVAFKIWKWYKNIFRIRSWELYKATKRRKFESHLYSKKYNSKELIEFVRDMGLKKGSTVLIHSSWNEFYNCTSSVNQIIENLMELVGNEGTIMMPAYPYLRKQSSLFDLQLTPTAAGIIPEVFRKYPNVYRSANPHSVCAWGKHAVFLTKDHHKSVTCWDELSPYYKLSTLNGFILTLGLGKSFVGTTMHTIDSLLRTELTYFNQFFTRKASMHIRLQNNEVITYKYLTADLNFRSFFTEKHHRRVIDKYFDPSKIKRRKLSNLTINLYDAHHIVNRGLNLARSGVVVYLKPKMKKMKI